MRKKINRLLRIAFFLISIGSWLYLLTRAILLGTGNLIGEGYNFVFFVTTLLFGHLHYFALMKDYKDTKIGNRINVLIIILTIIGYYVLYYGWSNNYILLVGLLLIAPYGLTLSWKIIKIVGELFGNSSKNTEDKDELDYTSSSDESSSLSIYGEGSNRTYSIGDSGKIYDNNDHDTGMHVLGSRVYDEHGDQIGYINGDQIHKL